MCFITDEIVYLFLVGVLWGVTNPLIKKGSVGIHNVKANNKIVKFLKELQYLATNVDVSALKFVLYSSGQ